MIRLRFFVWGRSGIDLGALWDHPGHLFEQFDIQGPSTPPPGLLPHPPFYVYLIVGSLLWLYDGWDDPIGGIQPITVAGITFNTYHCIQCVLYVQYVQYVLYCIVCTVCTVCIVCTVLYVQYVLYV